MPAGAVHDAIPFVTLFAKKSIDPSTPVAYTPLVCTATLAHAPCSPLSVDNVHPAGSDGAAVENHFVVTCCSVVPSDWARNSTAAAPPVSLKSICTLTSSPSFNVIGVGVPVGTVVNTVGSPNPIHDVPTNTVCAAPPARVTVIVSVSS